MASATNQFDSSYYSSSSAPPPRWHVFLSFRGEDTRKTFTGHLYSALDQDEIRTFMDDTEQPRGEEISPQLLKTIQESRVSIVVFSKNYASSRCCLDELVIILKCKRTTRQLVVPVFYDVDSSVVRYKTRNFAEAFESHKKRFGTNMEIVEKWEGALTEAANLPGYDLQNDANGYESKLIQRIVKLVRLYSRRAWYSYVPCSGHSSVPSTPVPLSSSSELNINQSDSSHFTPLSSTPRWHVFLSFRGIDTRKKFTGHLITAFKQAGIQAFIDDDELPRGKDVMSELLKAIQESKILIVVFSKNYAHSEWCLDELVKIMECKRTTGQLVFPIFYDVRPSDVREQNGSFAEAFKSHKGHFKSEMEKVEKWKAALTEVALTEAANLAGWDLENAWNGYEPRLIQDVVEKVLFEVNPKHLNVAEHPVGTDSHVRKINSLLSLGSGVRLIGIYGMGGIGKTTIAKAVYNNNFSRFDGSCFIANVRERSKQPSGLVSLQEQLLSEILVNGKLKVGLAERGSNLMKDRFSSRRIFLVLDDVDNLRQVKALGDTRWFGSGSIIMITTRDVNLLNQVQVNERYEVEGLTENESLELFSWHAFRKSVPLKDYENISKSIVTYTRGLPLALEVLGSYLYGKTVEEWDCAFEKLQEIPNTEIQKILRISYDSLDDDEVKDIFLDIACFFVGMNKDVAINILDACGFFTKVGIRSLMDRGLLKIEKENDLWMHEHLRDMGREIIREKSPKPETRSRLWRQREVCDVLRNKKGTEAIEGVILDLPALDKRRFSTEAFKRMDSLRLLLINNVYIKGRFKHIFDELRCLRWHYCPLKCLPPDFHPEKLVILDLQYCKLNRLWQGIKFLENLKILNLSYSKFLETTPDFTEVPKLEKLLLEGCGSLMDFHPSIESLDVLAYLNLKQCKKLRNLPSSICNIKSLECLDLDGCSNLKKLPDSIGRLTSLKSLSLKECNRSLITFPVRFFSCHTSPIGFVPPLISSLCSLTKFNLDGCNLSDEDIPDNIGSLSSLRALHLSKNCFRSLPSTLSQLSNLEDLWLMNCTSLQSVPELPPTLERLHADGCTSMLKLPNLSNLNHLEDLYLRNCIGLTEIQGLENLNSVRSIRMEGCSSLKTTFVDSLVQKYTKLGKSFQFLLPRSEIPGWFSHGRTGSFISFNMPLDVKNRLGMTLWIVYSAKYDVCMAGYSPCAIIRKGTNVDVMKHLCLYADISVTKKEHSWVTYIPWTNFDYPIIEGGERFEVRIEWQHDVVVKECGIYT